MKLFTTKIFIILTSVCLLLFFAVGEVKANNPDVIGQVVTSTGAPVSGVWVKWTDRRGSYRHEQTDSNGNFIFENWSDGLTKAERDKQRTTRIDSNLDGAVDTYQADNSNAGNERGGFNCYSNVHTYTVVPPVTMSGSFSTVAGILINNGSGTIVLNDIVFTSSTPPTTPTPTPTGLTTKVVNFGIVPVSGLSGTVFIDSNLNGVQDAGESGYSGGVTISVTGTTFAKTTTDGAGNYSFAQLPNGSYTVYVSIPNNYSSTSPTNAAVTIPPGKVANFGMVSGFTVTGNVFNDANKNLKMDSGETTIANAVIDSPEGTVNMYNGAYDIQDMKAGTYTISYISPLPTGFYMLYPKPPSFQVTVGAGCITDTTTGSSCSARGDIIDLNFAVSDSWPWFQTYGLDLRFDDGVTNILPASTTCGGGSFASGTTGSFSSPGIIFSGDSSTDFGQGTPSNKNWVVGGISYPEVFSGTNPLKISTQSLRASAQKAGIPLTPLSSVVGCSNPATDCNLPNNLAKGVYVTNGDIRFRRQFTSTFVTGNTYVFISGNSSNIYFENNARSVVPLGATVIYSAGADMLIDPTIRPATNTCPVPAGQLQGIFSADRHITIEGNNGNCSLGADTMLNIDGTLIANAAKLSGKFQNKRDLCADNRSFPTLTIKARPDFILNTPGFLTQQQTITHEETP